MGRTAWLDRLRAHVALIGAQVTVWTTPTGSLVQPPVPVVGHEADPRREPQALLRAQQLGRAVRSAASWGLLRPSCLVRALALSRLLEASDLDGGVIRIGVRQSSRGVQMHAWMEYGGVPLGEQSESPAAFDRLTDVTGPTES